MDTHRPTDEMPASSELATPKKGARPGRRRCLLAGLLIVGALGGGLAAAGYWHINQPHMSEA